MPTFRARYVADCARCGKPIEVGQYMSWNPRGETKKTHFDCDNVNASPNGNGTETAPDGNGTETTPAQVDLVSAIVSAVQPHIKAQVNADDVKRIALETIQSELANFQSPIQSIEVRNVDSGAVNRIDTPHRQFPKLLGLAQARMDTYLYGVSGGGKTTAAKHVADALSLPFYAISLNIQSTPSLLIGFKTANGEYAETDFYKWYVNGGVFLFDEYDNTSGNLQTTLNTALDNRVCSFPNGLAKRHPDAICFAAGNTVGLGANGTYSSRQVMDSAARERFIFLKWEYDIALESVLVKRINSKNGDLWHTWIQLVRHHVESLNLKVLVSPRATLKGAKLLLDSAYTIEEVADMTLFKGIDADTRSKVLASNPLPKMMR